MKQVTTLALLITVSTFAFGAETQTSAADLMHAGLAAMGGEPKIRALTSLHFEATMQRNLLEESERPEGPYIVETDQIEEWRDLAHGYWKQTSKMHPPIQPELVTSTVVVNGAVSRIFGKRSVPGSGEELQLAVETLALSPERVMLTALAAADLHRLPDTVLQSVPHQCLQFTWNASPVRIFVNAETHLPTAVEWVSAHPFGGFWSVWGDVTTRVYYSLWWLQNGIHYPLQADVVRNGLPDQTITISKIGFNVALAPEAFDIPEATRTAFAARAKQTSDDLPLGRPNRPASEIVPGIVFIPGSWNTTLVKQDDGIVVLEAPISSGYSAKVIDEIHKRFPGARIKAAITTSDSWPHIGGVREYVAAGIPVYVLDRTVPLIERFLRAPHTRYPDSLARSPRKAELRAVSKKMVIGSGANRMELFPIRGETSERQMMVYFPEHKLLYGSDPFQQMEDGSYFYPQTVSELAAAVEREHLAVERFFMMHMGPTPWSALSKVLQDASQ